MALVPATPLMSTWGLVALVLLSMSVFLILRYRSDRSTRALGR